MELAKAFLLLLSLGIVYFIGVFFALEINPLIWPWYGKLYLIIFGFGCFRAYLEN